MAVSEFRREILEGRFVEWFKFSQAIYQIIDGKMDLSDLMLVEGTTQADLNRLSVKGRALRRLESDPHLIKLAQSPFGEKALSPFTRTK